MGTSISRLRGSTGCCQYFYESQWNQNSLKKKHCIKKQTENSTSEHEPVRKSVNAPCWPLHFWAQLVHTIDYRKQSMVHTKNRFISILLMLPSHHVAYRGFQLLLACSFFFSSKLMPIVPACWKHHYLQEVSPLCERERERGLRIVDRAELFVPLCVLVHGFEIKSVFMRLK